MVLQFQPYPIKDEPPEPHPITQAAQGIQNALAMYLQIKQQQDTAELARQQRLIELARARSDYGDDFINQLAAAGVKMPGMVPALRPTTSATPAAQAPAAPPPTLASAAGADPYKAIQDPLGLPDVPYTPYTPAAAAAPAKPNMTPAVPTVPAAGGGVPSVGKVAAVSGPQSVLDITPEYLASLRKSKGTKGVEEFQKQQTFLADMRQKNAQTTQMGITNSNALRDDYMKASLPLQTQTEAMAKLNQIRQKPGTPVSDIGLMAAFMQVLSPGALVREGQYARLEDTAGIPDKVRDLYNSLIEGKGLKSLTPTQRQEFLSTAANIYKGSLDQHAQRADFYRGVAQRQGMNPEDVVAPIGMPNFDPSQYVPSRAAVNPDTAQRIAEAEAWLKANPTSPKATAVRQRIASMRG